MELLALAVAGTVAYVAWQQWKTNDDRLRLELFDKRFTVYTTTRDFLIGAVNKDGVTDAELRAFRAATGEAAFLFDYDVSALVTEHLVALTVRHSNLRVGLDTMPDSERDDATNRMTAIMKQMEDAYLELPRRFRPYLRITRRS